MRQETPACFSKLRCTCGAWRGRLRLCSQGKRNSSDPINRVFDIKI